MKRIRILLVTTVVFSFIIACGKKAPDPLYQPDSKEYTFFKTLAAKSEILNPDQVNELIKTSSFNIYTNDVMPIMYRQWQRYSANLNQIPNDQVSGFIYHIATREAEKRLLALAARKNNVSVPEDTLQAELEKIYASVGGEQKFIEMITTQGITMDYVKADVQNSVLAKKYLDDHIFNTITVSEEEISKVYNEDKNEDKTATVRHILLMTTNKSDSEKVVIRKKIEDILKRARKGEDFAKLAKQYSEDPGSKENGGLYENFERGKMVKPFEDASFELPIGSISDVVETQYGYHIIKVISRAKETRPVDEVKAEIEQRLLGEKKQASYESLVESLKEKYKYQELFKA